MKNMKTLIILAFLAVATALPEPMHLRPSSSAVFEEIDFRPLIVPKEIMEKLNAVGALDDNDVPAPISLPSAPSVDAVRFVDSPLEAAEEAYAVKFVETPIASEDIDLPASISLSLAPSVDAVRFVDSPLEVAEEAYVVKFVEEVPEISEDNVPAPLSLPLAPSVDAEEVHEVKFVESPIETPVDAVQFVEEAENVFENPSELQSVRVADLPINEEIEDTLNIIQPLGDNPRFPGKQYTNPTWRSVKDSLAEAPIDVPALAVRFVEEAKNVIENLRTSELSESVKVMPINEEFQNAEQPLVDSPFSPIKQYADPTWR
ncbi:uncharacterized protein LOC113521723 isoform X2 [Galleria mellonella]|uniref:Uncharacterized protein LOC113521723 isoform X2 n=1 Tax=Galleria mellonella TaxID=7137 RepID=A0A6J1X7Y5_GALME|nr:uncharacterized protein LOC113521723 isoform X2 [Galleria mellonella]